MVAACLNPALRNVKSVQEFIEANAYQVLKNIAEEMNIKLEREIQLVYQDELEIIMIILIKLQNLPQNVSNSWRNY